MRGTPQPRFCPPFFSLGISGLLLVALSLAFLTTAHGFCTTSQHGWEQTTWVPLGEMIPSDNNAPVSLSPDGRLLHVGAREFTWSRSQWELTRGDVDGESYVSSGSGYWDQAGNWQDSPSESMCMSGDNSHVAFGADNKVRVYEWKSGAWTRKGNELAGANGFGASVSLSKDGGRLAVGAPSHPAENCTTGAVSVYEWNGGSNLWVQMGESMFCYNKTDDQVGKSISLSGDGSRVAIGAPGFDGPDQCSNDYYYQGCWSTKPDMGQVRVYEWDPSDGAWLTLAISASECDLHTRYESIDGDQNDHFGTSVAISEDGNRLIVGNDKPGSHYNDKSEVRAYQWAEPMTATDWSGETFNVGDAWVRLGWCDFKVGNAAANVRLSADGNFFAVGGSNYQSSTVDRLITLKWGRGEWTTNDGPCGISPQYSGQFSAFGIQGYEFEMGGGGLIDPTCSSNSNCYTGFGSSFAIAGDDMSTRVAVRASSGVYVFHVTYCDTSAPPENGGTGECPSKIAPNQNCWTNCSDGFVSTGQSKCNAQGQLYPGMCLVTSTFQNGTGFGASVVVSDDGNTVAVMNAPGPGHVRVYEYSQESSEWTQVGNDILSNDEKGQQSSNNGYMYEYEFSGYPQAVSLSSDGSRLAIGYPHASGVGQYPQSGVGRARVFERQSNTWIQVGEDIIGGQGNSSAGSWCDDMDGSDCSWWYQEYLNGLGNSVSLSADGSRLAVGSIGTSYSTGSYINGRWSTQSFTLRQVRVYQEPDSGLSQWSKLGNTLDAAAGGTLVKNSYDRMEYGASVSLSDDGSTLAISGWKGTNATVHRFDSNQNAWLQVGNVIRLKERWSYDWYHYSNDMVIVSDPIGPSIALSGDSKRVIVGSYTQTYTNSPPGFVGVFEINYGTGNWTLMGDYIEGVKERSGSNFGSSVAISHDGSRIAIGDPYAASPHANYNGDDKGATRVYEWNSDLWSWRPAIGSMYGSQRYSGASVSLSGDGTRLVIGESPAGKATIRDLPADLKASEAGDNGGKQPGRDKGNNGNGANPQKPPSQSGAAGEDKQPVQQPKGERRKKAEETRDAILGDIKDARQKKKAELLANAAIAGVKVKKLKAKLIAADEDTACSTAFTKAGMSSGDGACVATAASSRKRRRLFSTAYDVELLFSSSTVSDDALTAAAQELTDNGVGGVTYEASVDPVAELKTVPGVDTSKIETFETEAEAAVAETKAEFEAAEPPPSPPKPNLVLDDDDGAVHLHALTSALVVTALALIALT